jgi:membrane associated rhomboid family serine protease
VILGRKKKNKKDQVHYLCYFKAPFIIIALNAFVFFRTNILDFPAEVLQSLILYPANIVHGKYLCVLTAGFIHADISHFAFNMLGVLVFGHVVERRLGVLKTLYVYFGASIISLLASVLIYMFLLNSNTGIIGASGAVMGLLGAAVLFNPFSITYEMILPIPTMFKGWGFFYLDIKGFLGGEQDGVSHLAHVLGFASIVILVYLLSHEDKEQMQKGFMINILSFCVLVGFILLYQRIGGV